MQPLLDMCEKTLQNEWRQTEGLELSDNPLLGWIRRPDAKFVGPSSEANNEKRWKKGKLNLNDLRRRFWEKLARNTMLPSGGLTQK